MMRNLEISSQKGTIEKMVQLKYVKLLILHFFIGFLIFLYENFSFYYFAGSFGYLLFITLQNRNRNNEALMAAAYISGAEVFWRMTEALIFYETGKYGVILFLGIGLFFKGASSKTVPFWIYLLLLFPGIVIASMTLDYDNVFRKAIAFNLSGPVCLGVSAVYCYYKKISKVHIEKVISMLLMPLISMTVYLYLYTPEVEVPFIGMNGNYRATAGYGPNQISTVLGLGAFLLVTRLFVIKSRLLNIIDLILFGLVSYRAMITFSRGGILTAVVCILAFIIILYYKKNLLERTRLRYRMFFLSVAILATWSYTTIETGGLIINRYTGKDRGGMVKEDITTGRLQLFETELEGFYHNPVIGLGVGKGRDYREEELGVEIATHSEVSRLLSEHGLLGLTAVLILMTVPFIFWSKFQNNYYFLAFLAFWFLTINHSAMRIALPALVYGLALLYIVDEKKNFIHR